MRSLVYKEFVQLKSYLIQVFGLMAIASLLFGRIAQALLLSILYALPVTSAMTLPQMVFQEEERGNTFVFLRALPIRPREIVAAKYAVSALTTAASLAAIGLAWLTGAIGKETALASAFGVGLTCFALSALSLFLHFWLGPKQAKTALILVTFGLAIPLVVLAQGEGGTDATLGRLTSRFQPLAASWTGLLFVAAVGAALLGVSFAASSAIFTRRDVSRLP